MKRRILLALGAALLVGGWGTTRYAYAESQTVKVGTRYRIWNNGTPGPYEGTYEMYPTRWVYAAGVAGMAVGAGLIGFGWRKEP